MPSTASASPRSAPAVNTLKEVSSMLTAMKFTPCRKPTRCGQEGTASASRAISQGSLSLHTVHVALLNQFLMSKQAFMRSRVAVQTKFVGMMQYDGDLKLPARFLVPPPAISGVSGELLAQEGVTTFACSETQKFGHVSVLESWARHAIWQENGINIAIF